MPRRRIVRKAPSLKAHKAKRRAAAGQAAQRKKVLAAKKTVARATKGVTARTRGPARRGVSKKALKDATKVFKAEAKRQLTSATSAAQRVHKMKSIRTKRQPALRGRRRR